MINTKKKVVALLLVAALALTGCAGGMGLKFGDSDVRTRALVSIATRNVSCQLASGDPEVVRTLQNLYTSLKTGTISEDALAQLSELTLDRPTLAADIQDLIGLLGVSFDAGTGTVLGLEGLDEAMFKTIESAWNQGLSMCRNT